MELNGTWVDVVDVDIDIDDVVYIAKDCDMYLGDTNFWDYSELAYKCEWISQRWTYRL